MLYKAYPQFLSSSDFPTGFAYLASALRNANHEVFGLNPNNDPGYASGYEMLYEKLSRTLKDTEPELIGLGGLCVDYTFVKDAIQIIRKLSPDVPIVCGSGIINHDSEFAFKALHPDFCIVQEAEEALVQLANTIETGTHNYDQIANLGYWAKGVPKFTKQDLNYMDINKLCFPDYEPFGMDEMLNEYSLATRTLYRFTRTNPRPMPIITARSCPFSCSFCVHDRGPKFRARSIENIVQELTLLYERYRFNILIIDDELFAVNKQRLKEFSIALIDARKSLGWDFEWCFQTHASASLTDEELKLAKEAGCYFFSYGLESASPRVLASMNKKSKPSQIIKAVELANAANIGFGGNLIFGDTVETTETISESMDFFLRYGFGNHMFFGDIQPYPGSKLFEDCTKMGLIGDKLTYYERIGERIFNLTSIPDDLWFPWIKRLQMLGSLFAWEKSADAFSVAKESETVHHSNAFYSGKTIWNVGAKCPHCGKEGHYRELLESNEKKQDVSFFGTFRHLFFRFRQGYGCEKDTRRSALSNFWNYAVKRLLRILKYVRHRLVFHIFYRKHPLFKLLEPLGVNEREAPLSFVTGCPYCRKRFKINLTGEALNGNHAYRVPRGHL